jgi:hypothetical protein
MAFLDVSKGPLLLMEIPRVYCDVTVGLLCITKTKRMLQKANSLGRYVLCALFLV